MAEIRDASVVAIDFETRGTASWLPETAAVGLGVAWITEDGEWYAKYLDQASMDEDARCVTWRGLASLNWEGQVRIAHNVYFDAGIARMELLRVGIDADLQFTHDTYSLYKQLAGEGWFGQSWGLKSAQVDLLGWADTNEAAVDDWLLAHGYHKQGPRSVPGESPEQHLAAIHAWIAINPETRKVTPEKGEMWRVPPEILGEYCILDCISTLQLWVHVLEPALREFSELAEFHTGEYIESIYLLAEQQRTGIRINRELLLTHRERLIAEIASADAEIRACPVLSPHISGLEQLIWETQLRELKEKEPERFLKKKLSAEPPMYKKDGTESSAWRAWAERRDAPPVQSKNWEKWAARFQELEAGPRKEWSPASGEDLRWLLYTTGLVEARDGFYDKKGNLCTVLVTGVNGEVELDATDSGLYPADAELFSQLPEWAAPIGRHKDASKELSYVESYLELLFQHGTEAEPNWRLHPGWRIHGTVTGRLAGADPNLQQIPKSLLLLDCFIPDPGTEWVEGDWTALEPHVLAELSRDAALLDLYGPDAKPGHDRYLFTLAGIRLPFTAPVRALYDPKNPDPLLVKQAKKECKGLREAGKVLVLSGDYGAGAKKKWRGCQLRGIHISLEEMQAVHEAQLELHAGVYKEFGPALEQEWSRRGGWVLSGLGHPVCVDAEKKKDIVNRVIQKTGHDIHVLFIARVARALRSRGISWKGIVWDFHDQLIIQVAEAVAAEVLSIVEAEVVSLNAVLRTTVRLKLEPRIVSGMGEAKMEEAYNERKQKLG